MKILHKKAADIAQEEAHGGSGKRRLYINDRQTPSERVQGMTHGWLPAGQSFDWHHHDGIEELIYVLKGEGLVCDEDGEYAYKPGDVIIFPANIEHKVMNQSSDEHEFIFVRIYE